MIARVVAVKRKERRRDRRRTVVIRSAIGSWTAVVTDISSGGIGGLLDIMGSEDARLRPGQRVEAILPLDDLESLAFTLVITRGLGVDLSFGARFEGVTDAQFRLIESYVTGRRHERDRRRGVPRSAPR